MKPRSPKIRSARADLRAADFELQAAFRYGLKFLPYAESKWKLARHKLARALRDERDKKWQTN